MQTNDPTFSSVRFLSRHELGHDQIQIIRKWDLALSKVNRHTSDKGQVKRNKAVHFKIEQTRVKKWLNEFKID